MRPNSLWRKVDAVHLFQREGIGLHLSGIANNGGFCEMQAVGITLVYKFNIFSL